MYDDNSSWGSGQWGPVGGGWSDHAWWFAHWPLLAALFAPIIILFIVWSLFWKSLALWHSAQRGSYKWFIVLLLVNTLGILEIIYLFGFAKLKFSELFSSRIHSK